MSISNHQDQLRKFKARCHAAGIRFTRPREVVLSCLLSADKPQTAYDVLAAIQPELPGAKPTTVYRALEFLVAQSIVHRVEATKSYLVCCQGGAHQHVQFVVCDSCGEAREIELDSAILNAISEVTEQAGFSPSSPMIEVHGTCANCKE